MQQITLTDEQRATLASSLRGYATFRAGVAGVAGDGSEVGEEGHTDAQRERWHQLISDASDAADHWNHLADQIEQTETPLLLDPGTADMLREAFDEAGWDPRHGDYDATPDHMLGVVETVAAAQHRDNTPEQTPEAQHAEGPNAYLDPHREIPERRERQIMPVMAPEMWERVDAVRQKIQENAAALQSRNLDSIQREGVPPQNDLPAATQRGHHL